MRILTRYLLRSHLGPFFFALITLTAILFVNTIARRFDDLAGKGLGLGVILEVCVLSLPHILALTLPMAVLVAVLYAFGQLAADNEVTALKASGINLIRMMMPLVVASVLFALFMVWFNDRVLPDSNNKLKGLISDIGATTPTLSLTEQVVNPISTRDYRSKFWIKPGRIDDASHRMYDIVIYDLSNARQSRTVYADSGILTLNPTQTDMMLTLYDGVAHETTQDQPIELRRGRFREQRIELKGAFATLQRTSSDYRSDREMSVAMLQGVVDTAAGGLARVHREAHEIASSAVERVLAGPTWKAIARPPSMGAFSPAYTPPMALSAAEFSMSTSRELARLASEAQMHQDRMNAYRVEIHKKFAIPFACIIFVLIGAPIAVRFPRGGVGMVIASSLTIFGIYYTSLIGGEALGDRGTIAPFWGPWAPNVLFGALAVWSLSRMGREHSTARGGTLDDVWIAVRGMFTGAFWKRRRTTDMVVEQETA